MAAITAQQTSEAGINGITFSSAAGGGDTIAFNASLMVFAKNDSGGSITVTCPEQVTGTITDSKYGDLEKADASIAVAAGAIGVFGPFKESAFKDSSGNINLTYSSATSLTIAGIIT